MSSLFITALFTVTKLQRLPKCPSTDKWIKKMWYIHTMENDTAKKMKFCHLQQTWIDLEATMLSEIRKTKKDKYHMILDICGIKIK